MTFRSPAIPAAALLSLACCLPAAAQNAAPAPRTAGSDWAEQMFDTDNIEFGVVARGAETKTQITVTNKYLEDVYIASVGTSCGCTAAKPDRKLLKTWEKAVIDVEMDTRRFTRDKSSNVIVTFTKPRYAEVRVPVHMYVRTDVVLEPGGVNFGSLGVGEGSNRTVRVSYAGRNSWRILETKSSSDLLDVEFDERSRTRGSANYDLKVTLAPGAPLGPIRERITLVTDDASNPNVPVLVEGVVEPDVTVSPEVWRFGTLRPGQRKMVNVVVKGRKRFAIESVEADSADEAFAVRTRMPTRESNVHVLPISLTAPREAGDYEETFTVTIPGRDEPVTFKAVGRIASR